MGTTDGDALLEAHDLGQHSPSVDDRNSQLPGQAYLRILFRYGTGDHHCLRVSELRFPMAEVHSHSLFSKLLRDWTDRHVGPGNLVAGT